MKTIEKQKSHAFGKDVYLLGINEYGEKMWLEAAKWDCEWYWGFGYIETYQLGNGKTCEPERANDINSHTHWDSRIYGKQEKYNTEKSAFLPTEFHHHFNDHKEFQATVLSDNESWQLADLMKTAYTLKATAELYHTGNSHLTSVSGLSLKNKKAENNINKVLLPRVFDAIYKILEPKQVA